MLFYRAALPLSRQTLNYVAGIVRRHRVAIGSRWRRLDCRRQALLVLVHLRKGETFAQVAAGFDVSTSTAWRYVNEVLPLLAARAPRLRGAVRAARGHAYVVLDGTLIAIDRVAADRPFYSGKHRHHGMNLQVLASPCGDVLWVSGSLPGSVHGMKAARIWGVLEELQRARILTLADKGYHGAVHALTPYKGKGKPQSQKDANRAHARHRGPGERANAQLKQWGILRKLRCCPAAQASSPAQSTPSSFRKPKQPEKGSVMTDAEVIVASILAPSAGMCVEASPGDHNRPTGEPARDCRTAATATACTVRSADEHGKYMAKSCRQ